MIQYSNTIWIPDYHWNTRHLNPEQVKVCNSVVSLILRCSLIRSPLYYLIWATWGRSCQCISSCNFRLSLFEIRTRSRGVWARSRSVWALFIFRGRRNVLSHGWKIRKTGSWILVERRECWRRVFVPDVGCWGMTGFGSHSDSRPRYILYRCTPKKSNINYISTLNQVMVAHWYV